MHTGDGPISLLHHLEGAGTWEGQWSGCHPRQGVLRQAYGRGAWRLMVEVVGRMLSAMRVCEVSVMACMVDTYVGSVIRAPVSGPSCTLSPFKNLHREAQR